MTGPVFETKTEVQYLLKLKHASIGMSTVPEFLSGRALGMKTLGFSMITDVGALEREVPLTHLEVIEAANKSVPSLTKLILKVLDKIQLNPEIKEEIEANLSKPAPEEDWILIPV